MSFEDVDQRRQFIAVLDTFGKISDGVEGGREAKHLVGDLETQANALSKTSVESEVEKSLSSAKLQLFKVSSLVVLRMIEDRIEKVSREDDIHKKIDKVRRAVNLAHDDTDLLHLGKCVTVIAKRAKALSQKT